MNEETVTAFLSQAGAVPRGLAGSGWDRIAGAVIDAVRATPRGGSPLRACDSEPTAAAGGVLAVDDPVLRGMPARALRLDEVCIPTLIEVAVEGPVS